MDDGVDVACGGGVDGVVDGVVDGDVVASCARAW